MLYVVSIGSINTYDSLHTYILDKRAAQTKFLQTHYGRNYYYVNLSFF